MRYLIIALLFTSCMTTNKAVHKVAGTNDFTSPQKQLLAVKCSAMFPVSEYISEGTKIVDSTALKQAMRALESQIQDAGQDINKLSELLSQKEENNEALREMLFATKKKYDSLQITKAAFTKVPCPESHFRDTSYREATAKLAVIQENYNNLQAQLAKTEVASKAKDEVIAQQNKQIEELKNRPTKFWKGLLLGIIAGILLPFVIRFFLKTNILGFMKSLIFLALIAVVSCNNPDGKVHKTSSEWNGKYEVIAGGDKPQQVMVDYVFVQPTWGQAFYFNIKSGGIWELIAGMVLLVASVVICALLYEKYLKTSLTNILLIFITVAGSLAFTFTNPGTIKFNNEIKIEKNWYDENKSDLKAMWETLYLQKRIVGTSGD